MVVPAYLFHPTCSHSVTDTLFLWEAESFFLLLESGHAMWLRWPVDDKIRDTLRLLSLGHSNIAASSWPSLGMLVLEILPLSFKEAQATWKGICKCCSQKTQPGSQKVTNIDCQAYERTVFRWFRLQPSYLPSWSYRCYRAELIPFICYLILRNHER